MAPPGIAEAPPLPARHSRTVVIAATVLTLVLILEEIGKRRTDRS